MTIFTRNFGTRWATRLNIYLDLVFVFLDDISHHFINTIMMSNHNRADVLSLTMHMTLLRQIRAYRQQLVLIIMKNTSKVQPYCADWWMDLAARQPTKQHCLRSRKRNCNCNCNCNLFAFHKSRLGYNPEDMDIVSCVLSNIIQDKSQHKDKKYSLQDI